MQYCRNPVEADRERASPFPTHDGRSGPPKGLFGLLYWYALYVPHRFIFTGMIEERTGPPHRSGSNGEGGSFLAKFARQTQGPTCS